MNKTVKKLSLLLSCAFAFCSSVKSQGNIIVLGIAQDGGYPHIGCEKSCCQRARNFDSTRRFVVSLGLVDSAMRKWWLIEATPDIGQQLHLFDSLTQHQYPYLPEGIFVTHAHIGHYAGFMQLGREALGAKKMPVYSLPRMGNFLASNGPWSQLVALENIILNPLKADSQCQLTNSVGIAPFLVPHRDEFSETCGFKIEAGGMKYLFIPDIDKWEKWNRNIVDEVGKTNVAFLDCTFYDGSELPGRNLAEIPHPTFQETRRLFSDRLEAGNIVFIHLNHSNPLLWNPESHAQELRLWQVAKQGKWY